MTSTTLRLGQTLFRLRSLTPVPVILACLALLYRSRGLPPVGGEGLDALLDGLGLTLACVGQALRFYTLGWVPEGTSGQNLTIQASTLNTRGPYSYVRNPLYVGNLGIILGLLLIANDGWVTLLGLGFFFGEYFFIIRAEENFLRGRFGAAFDEFCQKVPRWVPRLSPAYADGRLRDGSFDAPRALKKEINPFSAWALGAVVLFGWEWWGRGTLTQVKLVGLGVCAGVVLLALGVIKAWKKGWLFT